MYPIYTSDTSHSTTSNTPTLLNTTTPSPNHHARKLSHVQVGKKAHSQDEYNTTSSIMIPFDELQAKPSPGKSISSDTSGPDKDHYLFFQTPSSQEIKNTEKQSLKTHERHWLFASKYWGPYSEKGKQWPLFSYLMVALAIIIFSGELLLSKQSSGEFLELEPFNYMLGPSIEIMIQVGARFPPCMRRVESMPPEERYVCLHTIQHTTINQQQSNKTGSTLLLLDPVVNLADPRLLNSSCSLSSICGMSNFYQQDVPDQTYRIFTPLLIHTGLIHLVVNIAILIFFGIKVERIINSLRFTVLFVGSGIFGHVLGANFALPTTPFLGFSSSLFGLIGFLYIDLIENWKRLEQPIRYLIRLLLGTALSFILGLLPGVDNFSHMGGLVAGVLLSVFLLRSTKPIENNKVRYAIYFLRFIALFLYGLFLGILLHHFSTSNIDEECPYCRYVSCLPIYGFCD